MIGLSSPVEAMGAHYGAIVIGSGYGGGVAASRLARAGLRVCLLERGREIRPGEYPATAVEAMREVQWHSPRGQEGPRTGMFDFHVQEDISVLVGCGLGGTSLINANVALEGIDGIWTDERWPAPLRGQGNQVLDEYYRRARAMLGSTPYPDSYPALAKIAAHSKSAASMGVKWYKPPLNVTFQTQVNHAGVAQKACNNCGDCVTGCNHLAKNTTLMNYLPDAWNHGAELFTECSVSHIERADDRWLVRFEVVGRGRGAFDNPALSVSADLVVVAAGTLGSTEILLQSKERGLALSDRVGQDFSGNGDVLGFAYNNDQTIGGIGAGTRADGAVGPVGPTIASIIDNRGTDDWRDGWVMAEGAIPGALTPLLSDFFSLFSGVLGKDTDAGVWDWLRENARAAISGLCGPYHGALHNTQTYLGMGHDGSSGQIELTERGLRISWPGVGKEPIFETLNDRMKSATAALGGTYVKNPIWTDALGDTLLSVHPLGGCAMADDASRGVTNHKGQVFAGREGTAVHDGLYVADGSIIPLSIGVNPLLTIAALAERIVAIMAEERGFTLDTTTPSSPDQRPQSAGQDGAAPQTVSDQAGALGVEFTESMNGYVTTDVTGAAAGDHVDAYDSAYERGRDAASPLAFNLTIRCTDLDEFLSDPEYRCGMFGTVSAGALSADALTVQSGQFQLFVDSPTRPEVKNMIYRMVLSSIEGETFYFHGYKTVGAAGITELWRQNTTLYTRVYRGRDATGELAAKGILHMDLTDFARQLSTVRALNADDELAKLTALARFGAHYAGALHDMYGGVRCRPHDFNQDALARVRRLAARLPGIHRLRRR